MGLLIRDEDGNLHNLFSFKTKIILTIVGIGLVCIASAFAEEYVDDFGNGTLIDNIGNATTLMDIPIFLNQVTGGFFGIILAVIMFFIPLLRSEDKFDGMVVGSFLALGMSVLLFLGGLLDIATLTIFSVLAGLMAIVGITRK